jgi:hypothetical protein
MVPFPQTKLNIPTAPDPRQQHPLNYVWKFCLRASKLAFNRLRFHNKPSRTRNLIRSTRPLHLIMSAVALIAVNPDPGDADIDAAMAGDIFPGGTYVRVRAAIRKSR